MQEEQLFGAPPGACRAATLSTHDYETGRQGVTFALHPINRKDLMCLRVAATKEQGLGTVLGAFIPLLQKGPNVGVQFGRRSLWAIHNRLGRMGYEVEISGCGREPKH